MTKIVKLCVAFVVLTQATAWAADPWQESVVMGEPLYRMPITKGYAISTDYYPVQIAHLVQRLTLLDSPAEGYGQFGIPPIYVAGSNVMVRATPDVHARIAKYLTDLGVRAARPAE